MVRSKVRQGVVPYVFLLPAVLLVFWWNYLPIFWALQKSFVTKSLFGGEEIFVGLSNYIAVLQKPLFLKSIYTTLYFVIALTFIQTISALGLSLLVNTRVKGVGVFRAIYLLPVAIAQVIAATIWGFLFMESGMLNGILSWFGIAPQLWLISPHQALWSIMLVLSWVGIGFWSIFYLAGLKDIDFSLYEAAAVDGSNWWHSFIEITWPMLRRVTLFIVITDTILNFLVFEPVYVLTQGGPMESTNLLMYEVYRTIIGYGQIYRGAAVAIIALLIIAGFVSVEFLIIQPKEN